MFKCHECFKYFDTILAIKDQYKYVHIYGHVNFNSIICPSESCNTMISTWSGLWRHLKAFHNNSSSLDIIEDCNIQFTPTNHEINPTFTNFEHIGIREEISIDLGVELITDLLHNFCSSLLANGVNNSTVHFVLYSTNISAQFQFHTRRMEFYAMAWIGGR